MKPVPLFQLQSATVTLSGRKALDRLDWELRPGSHWLVVGPNGAGKSTLLRLLKGEVWPDQAKGGRRRWRVDGRWTESPIRARPMVGWASAELQDQWERLGRSLTGVEAVATGLRDAPMLYAPLEEDESRRAGDMLESLGIGELAHRPFNTLSRGEGAKVLIARALVSGPRILALDECAAGLDSSSRRELFDFLDLAADQGASLVMASHRLDEGPSRLNAGLIFDRGRAVYQGPLAEVRRMHGAPRRRTGDVPAAVPAGTGGPPLVEVVDACVRKQGARLLGPIDFAVRPGERWLVLGPNGAGKTTLLRLLYGEVVPCLGGEVRWFGWSNPVELARVRERVGLVSPRLQARWPAKVTGLEAVLTGFSGHVGIHRDYSGQERAEALGLLEETEAADLAGIPVGNMSHGQRRRVLLARSLAGTPDLLLLDEPLSGLDESARNLFLRILERTVESRFLGLVFATHRPGDAPGLASNVLELGEGRVVRQGTAGEWTAC